MSANKLHQEIITRCQAVGKRYWAGDNISDVIRDGEMEQLIDEATEAFEGPFGQRCTIVRAKPYAGSDCSKECAKLGSKALSIKVVARLKIELSSVFVIVLTLGF